MSRLGAAYARHQLRRWTGRRTRAPGSAEAIYDPEGYFSLTESERDLLPQMSRCINCGICAMVAGRSGNAYLPDLSSSYLRPLHLLPAVRPDLTGMQADLEEAAAACPVGVPLPAVAAMVRRLSEQ